MWAVRSTEKYTSFLRSLGTAVLRGRGARFGRGTFEKSKSTDGMLMAWVSKTSGNSLWHESCRVGSIWAFYARMQEIACVKMKQFAEPMANNHNFIPCSFEPEIRSCRYSTYHHLEGPPPPKTVNNPKTPGTKTESSQRP